MPKSAPTPKIKVNRIRHTKTDYFKFFLLRNLRVRVAGGVLLSLLLGVGVVMGQFNPINPPSPNIIPPAVVPPNAGELAGGNTPQNPGDVSRGDNDNFEEVTLETGTWFQNFMQNQEQNSGGAGSTGSSGSGGISGINQNSSSGMTPPQGNVTPGFTKIKADEITAYSSPHGVYFKDTSLVVGEHLYVNDNSHINGELSVVGGSLFSNISVNRDANVSGALAVGKTLTVGNSLRVDGNTFVTGGIYASGPIGSYRTSTTLGSSGSVKTTECSPEEVMLSCSNNIHNSTTNGSKIIENLGTTMANNTCTSTVYARSLRPNASTGTIELVKSILGPEYEHRIEAICFSPAW